MTDTKDLFGYANPQGSLFGESDDRLPEQRQDTTPDPQKIRLRLNKIIEKARSAERMPWSEKDVRMWQLVFPNMAKWLPEEEGRQLCLEFETEIERLARAA